MEQHLDVTTVIYVLGIAWALISGLLVYIWRNSMVRITKLETFNEIAVAKLIEAPVLTVMSHADLCSRTLDGFHKIVSMRMDAMEKNIGLQIEKAILQAWKNGAK